MNHSRCLVIFSATGSSGCGSSAARSTPSSPTSATSRSHQILSPHHYGCPPPDSARTPPGGLRPAAGRATRRAPVGRVHLRARRRAALRSPRQMPAGAPDIAGCQARSGHPPPTAPRRHRETDHEPRQEGPPMHTRLTDLLGIEHPVMLAGMGGVSYSELAAAVSAAGGFGCLGASTMGNETMVAEMAAVRTATDRPFGVDLLTAMPGGMTEQVEMIIDGRRLSLRGRPGRADRGRRSLSPARCVRGEHVRQGRPCGPRRGGGL